MTLDRRQFLSTLSVGGLALAGISACANPDNQPAQPAAGASESSANTAFPVEVTHRYGTTTVAAAPQRIVCVGQTDHDPLVALGLTPIAVGSFLDSTYTPVRPWNASHFPSEPTKLNMQELEFEKIASLTPDLILAVMSGITKEDYAKLTEIAPTVAQPTGYSDWAVPCRPHAEQVGAAVGKRAEAVALVDALDQRFAAVRNDNASLQGKTAVCAEWWAPDFMVLGTAAPRTQFLIDIGMRVPEELSDLVGKEYNSPLSAEKLDLLGSLDVVVWTTEYTENSKLLEHKLVAPLRSTRERRVVLAANGGNDDLLYSMDWGTVLSNGWAIDNAVPRFVKAVDGDPATDPNS